MQKREKTMFTSILIAIFCTITIVCLHIFNLFNAEDTTKKQELFNIFLTATLQETDGTKVFLKDTDYITIRDHKDNIIPYTIDNGNIKIQIPLYEYDTEYSGDFTKTITVDNNKHSTVVNDITYINTYDASSLIKAFKNIKELKVELDNYYIDFPSSFNGKILTWSLSKELEQSYETDEYKMTLNVTTDNNYVAPELEIYEGDTNIKSFVSPVEYRNVEVLENSDGSYLQFDLETRDVVSIADGVLIETNNIDNYIIIKYNDGLIVKYNDIYINKYDSEIKKGENIGISINDSIDIYTWSNGELIAAEWLYDGYERPLEGPNLPRMYQTDPTWADISYGYNTIGGGGCGPSSFAMTVSGLTGKVYTPEDIVEIIKSLGNGIWYYKKGDGSYYTIFPKLCDYFDLQIDDALSTSEESIKEALNDGKIVIVSVTRGKVYTGEGHFIVIRGLTEDGKFLINDSAKYFDLNTGYEYSDLKPITSARAIYN